MSSSYNNTNQPWSNQSWRDSVLSPAIEQAESVLEQSERTFSRTQQELLAAIRVRNNTPMSATDLSAKNQEIATLQQQLRRQEDEIASMRVTIEKQRATIKTQSETISNPRQHFQTPASASRFGPGQYGHGNLALPPPPPAPIFANASPNDSTPNRSGSIRPSGATPHQRQDSSPFSAPRSQQSIRQQPVRQPQGPGPRPTPVRQSRNVNDFGSPEPSMHNLMHGFGNMRVSNTQRGSAQSSAPTPTSSARNQTRNMPSETARLPSPPANAYFNAQNGMALIRPTDAVAPSPQPGTALVPPASGGAPNPIVVKFAEFIHMAEMYAYSHVNTPSTHKDQEMPEAAKDRLKNASSTTTAFSFMQTPYTRYTLVTKVILQYSVRFILTHDAFAGFDLDADREIKRCKDLMYQTTPAQVKNQLLTSIAGQVRKMRYNHNFQFFVDNIARKRGNELWDILKPMMHQKTSRDWEDLYDLMLKGYELAEMMHSGSEEYKFEFPATHTPFRKATMEPREQFQTVYTPDQLEQMGAAVRLGYTPLITARTSTAAGHVSSTQILKAFILLKNDR